MRELALLVAALSACNDPGVVIGELRDTLVLPAIPNRDLDLLFVIDDSPSMFDKQAALAAAFPQMIDVLSQLDGGLPNLHIGVVTSDMGTSASTTSPAPPIGSPGQGGCSSNGAAGALKMAAPTTDGASFLVDVALEDGTRRRNYDGALRDAFTANALVGAMGCGFEQHLSAMWHALDDNPANAGFLRPEANLAVVILADEDDCSARDGAVFGHESAALGPQQSFRCFRFGVECDEATNEVGAKSNCRSNESSEYIDPVHPYIDRLVALKGDERRVMVGVIAGNTAPTTVELRPPPGGGDSQRAIGHSCTIDYPGSGPAVADPAIRLKTFVEGFEGRATFTSVCSPDLSAPLQQIGSTAKGMMGDPCLDSSRLADISPAPGVQPSCEVLDIADSAPTTQASLAECSSGATDCYEIVADATACPATSDHLRVRLSRASTVAPDTWTYVRCKRAQ